MHDTTGRRAPTCALVLSTLLSALVAAPLAAQPTAAQQSAIRASCRADFQANCAGVSPGGEAALACLQQNLPRLSAGCKQAVGAAAGGSAGAKAAIAQPAAAAAPPAPAGPPAADAWPHTVSGPNGSATIYQPQVVSWPDHRTLDTRIALAITPTGAPKPLLGVIEVAFDTQAEVAERTVFLSNPRLVSSKFPLADAAQGARIDERIKEALANLGVKQVPLATLTMSLSRQMEKPPEAPVDNRPPRIFASAQPASLVVFDGEPVLAPVDGTSLAVAVNTNWDVFRDASNNTWYLLVNGGWLAAPDAKGPWMAAGRLPSAFATLPNDKNFAEVKKQIPGRAYTANDVPAVFVSTTPAAIIVTSGPPQFTPIPGTQLAYVSNTDAALFRDKGGRFYYLVSGRWFAAASLDGPWTFATPDLPPDFARIPANGPRGFVLVSVPGTPQAQEALLEAQLPQQGTLDRATAKLDVAYAGAPQFAPIPGTPLSYAVNTSFQVVQAGEGYFACYQGAWFAAPAPTGPWTLAPTVPAVIYTIPPSSPLYPCTFVKVYAATPTTVTYAYTAGYTMSYVSAGVVVYGTGYYYPPYVYPAPIPIYYPYPYSYAGATYYNPATGAWAQGGAIYGPYGGAAKAGYAYNPNTGAWAQGGAIYGPNGGAGAFSAYNPSTGSYAHGSAAWGPNGAAANASWYNANTARSGSTQQNSNAYGRWGSTTVSGPNQTVHTQSQSNQYGRAGSFSSSSGAKGAAVSGAGGNSAGAVKTSGGDVYAGADGNVYRKTDDGWQKYDDGSWNNVSKPTTQNANARSANGTQAPAAQQRTAPQGGGQYAQQRSAAQSRAGEGGGFEGMGQLEQDRSARLGGGARQQQFNEARGGEFAGRGGGGFRR
ncbi:MAG: hypothetical protein U1F10_11210 [Burkholderiales bacterium]